MPRKKALNRMDNAMKRHNKKLTVGKENASARSFAVKLKELRVQKGLTQKQLAEQVGISQPSIVSYENGLRFPSDDVLKRISVFFDVTADYFQDGENEESGEIEKTSEKTYRVNRLSELETNRIFAYIQSPDNAATPEEYERRSRLFKAYAKKYAIASPQNPRQKRTSVKLVTFDSLEELMEIGCLNYQQLFEDVFSMPKAVEIDAETAKLRDVLDSMLVKERQKIQQIAMEWSPSFWQSEEAQMWKPMTRACALVDRLVPKGERLKILKSDYPEVLVNVWKNNRNEYTIPLVAYPEIAKVFDVSLHWLLCGENVCCTAQNRDTEKILDAYYFMSKTTRKKFNSIVCAYAQKCC